MSIDNHPQINELIELCLKNDRKAQKMLYELLATTMNVVCKRYLYNKGLVTEVMNTGFLKVFTKLNSYNQEGSFEGWVRRIMVNSCLDENKKISDSNQFSIGLEDYQTPIECSQSELIADEKYIMYMIDRLPRGLSTVFNLVEIEGYKHQEVAAMLGISESASRSQLSKAKAALRQMLESRKI